MPAHRRAELLALHQKAAEQLIVHGKFEDASLSVKQLLKNQTTKPIGHLLAGYAAFREGDFGLARRHLEANEESGHESLLGSTLLCVCNFESQEWETTLRHLDSVQEQLESALPQHQNWTARFLATLKSDSSSEPSV